MNDMLEFFVPSRARDLEDIEKIGLNQYHITESCEFDVHPRQQLDDLTRLFDCLHREKSPTALFSKPELFAVLFSYIKALENSETTHLVTKQARHKICHEVSERLKKLLQVCVTYFRKKADGGINDGLVLCLRSTVKMYVFILCNVLLSCAPALEDDENISSSSQRSIRKRRRARSEQESGIGEDSSGVDQDGRELALTALIDVCSHDLITLWAGNIEESMLNLMLRMLLHMITQKANVQNDAQSVSGAIAVLLLKVSAHIVNRETVEPSDFVSPMIELALKTESAAQFLIRFVSEAESEDIMGDASNKIITALIEGMAAASLHDVSNDAIAAKNTALFFSEVARKCVSVTIRMSDVIIQSINSESYEVRKSVITCIAEMIIQRYTGPTRSTEGEEELKDKYLNEMLFRIMDCNPFVRNHTVHMWERLVDARGVPKRFHLAITNAVVGRLEDRNYLVRDSALQVIASILRKNWFGHVLNCSLIKEKFEEASTAALKFFDSEETYKTCLDELKNTSRPTETQTNDLLQGKEEETTVRLPLSEEQSSALNRVIFYEKALEFVELMNKALTHATTLLDSRTERDTIEAIKLIVACNEYRIEGSEKAFLRVLVMIYEGEIKIQCAVRDAFVEVVFNAFTRSSSSSLMKNTASAQKLIAFLRGATEGDISAVDRIFSLIKTNPSLSRIISGQFMDAVWGIADGTLDHNASLTDRRTAMRLFSLLCKHDWRELRSRKENVVEFLRLDAVKDNVLLAYCLKSLESECQDPQFHPISAKLLPSENIILEQLVFHLCRRTTAINSWLILADSSINVIHALCEVPALIYTYVLDYIGKRIENDPNALTQLFFILGRTALKQLVAIDSAERLQLKKLDSEAMSRRQTNDLNNNGDADTMHKELGLGSHEYKRHAIQELAQRRKHAIMTEGSIWHRFSKDVVLTCQRKAEDFTNGILERVSAVMALSELMVVSDTFCEKNLDLLFNIVSDKRESWVVKTNTVIALGDLACVHPNLLGPYLKLPTTGFFKLLNDDDLRVRAVTIQVCSHLVLGEMLRIRDHLYTIIKLVADPDESIANNAMTFVQNLALKEKEKTGNLIPPLVAQLSQSVPSEKFQLAMRSLLERVEGDKPTESLIERLCQRFESYSERGKKKRQMARNLAFCLGELNYSTERPIKKITSETCYQQYKQWLRDEVVLDYFKNIASKAKKVGQRTGSERRDKGAIEEWEARMQADSRCVDGCDNDVRSVASNGCEEEAEPASRSSGDTSAGRRSTDERELPGVVPRKECKRRQQVTETD
ncbi:putative condensin subunit 1 [Trypanosoma theileri]|uniref:Putative condensin subunit 1 n=1 Tax=Trypanosoma theileri TaxID=67003 RepID=A0A1X0NU41_9TRYP|nr:putative condensin subunit 1 [Trypanosoma theileri]ORC88224.1 putative condensin subunit 1 [Trypanosoma theileri]